MRRRRRPQREIAFSFDAFLDVVANVVGIIIKLILVAWVGARTYKAVLPPPLPPPAALADPEPLPEPTDPREKLLAQRRRQLDREADDIRDHDARARAAAGIAVHLKEDLDALRTRYQRLASERERAKEQAGKSSASAQRAKTTVAELQARSKNLASELAKLKSMPRPRKELRYYTPVSAPVQTEELMFECKSGRVTLIDHGAMLAEIRRTSRAKSDGLRTNWQVSDLSSPVGAFRLRYVLERDRSLLDGPATGAPVDGPFRFGLTAWEVVPVAQQRGEAEAQALTAGSAFRAVVDSLDAEQTAVTMWVYPDSFPLYRKLRDFLHHRDIVVAGRPLPDGVPIASSRHGTTSRGQ